MYLHAKVIRFDCGYLWVDDIENINSLYNKNDIIMEVDLMCVFVSGILLFSAKI
jgi:hypothetical protein